MSTIEKMDVESMITQRIPALEEVLSASNWFRDEEMTLDFGEYVGRPDENALMHTSLLTYFLANGWKIKEVKNRFHTGAWQSTSQASSTSSVNGYSDTEATSTSNGSTSSSGSTSDSGLVEAQSVTSASGSSDSSGKSSSSGTTQSFAVSGGAPYWCAYQTIVLTRRKMQSELVLNDMIASFTKAYNEGREINNARYDELVALYALMLSHTEDEANAIPVADITPADFKKLGEDLAASFVSNSILAPEDIRVMYDTALSNVRAALDSVKSAVVGLPENWLASREAEINRQFDAKEGQINSAMISNGTFATSAWANVLSGLARDRQYALTDLADSVVTVKVDTYGKVATLVSDAEGRLVDALAKIASVESTMIQLDAQIADVRAKLLESAVRVMEAFQKNRIGITELRNTVLKWMFDFMERREDDYPGLDQLATIADRLGYSDGAVGGSIAS